jgi:hypothetical protein
MTKGMNDFCFLHQTGIFECITKDENGNLVIDPKLAEFDKRMVRKLIRQIIIYQDRAMIEFKSGLQITINE